MTKTATPEPETPTKFVLGASDGDRLLLPDGLSCTPSRVQELSDEAVRLRAAALLASQQLNAAKSELAQAHAIDAAADRAASAANRELPTERAAEAATEALKLAERAHEAATKNARDGIISLARGIARDRGTWLVEQEAVGRSIRDDLSKTLQQLSEQFAQLQREDRVLAALRVFPEAGSLFEVHFGRQTRLDARFAENTAAEVAKQVRSTGGNMGGWVPRDQAHLLAELKRQIEQDLTPRPGRTLRRV
jgi:hypothetical protein